MRVYVVQAVGPYQGTCSVWFSESAALAEAERRARKVATDLKRDTRVMPCTENLGGDECYDAWGVHYMHVYPSGRRRWKSWGFFAVEPFEVCGSAIDRLSDLVKDA